MPRSELSVEASETSYTTADTAASGVVKDKNGRKTYKWHKKFAYQKFQGWRPILTPHNAGECCKAVGRRAQAAQGSARGCPPPLYLVLASLRRRRRSTRLAPPPELFFIAFGVLLIALGVPVLIASLNVVEVKVGVVSQGTGS